MYVGFAGGIFERFSSPDFAYKEGPILEEYLCLEFEHFLNKIRRKARERETPANEF